MTDLVPARPEGITLFTGEFLSINSPDSALGRCLAEIREFEALLREQKKILTEELLSRCDRRASWTVYEDGVKISGSSPAPVETWDGAELYSALWAFVDAGVLSEEAVNAAVGIETIYKPKKAGIQALRKLGGDVAGTIDGLAQEVEKDRRVTVTVASA